VGSSSSAWAPPRAPEALLTSIAMARNDGLSLTWHEDKWSRLYRLVRKPCTVMARTHSEPGLLTTSSELLEDAEPEPDRGVLHTVGDAEGGTPTGFAWFYERRAEMLSHGLDVIPEVLLSPLQYEAGDYSAYLMIFWRPVGEDANYFTDASTTHTSVCRYRPRGQPMISYQALSNGFAGIQGMLNNWLHMSLGLLAGGHPSYRPVRAAPCHIAVINPPWDRSLVLGHADPIKPVIKQLDTFATDALFQMFPGALRRLDMGYNQVGYHISIN